MTATPYQRGRLAGVEALTINYPHWHLSPVTSPYHTRLEEASYRQWLAGVNDAVKEALIVEGIGNHGSA